MNDRTANWPNRTEPEPEPQKFPNTEPNTEPNFTDTKLATLFSKFFLASEIVKISYIYCIFKAFTIKKWQFSSLFFHNFWFLRKNYTKSRVRCSAAEHPRFGRTPNIGRTAKVRPNTEPNPNVRSSTRKGASSHQSAPFCSAKILIFTSMDLLCTDSAAI